MPGPLRSCGNMLGEDYSSKLVWGDLKHPSWGDALVWKSNRPLSQNTKEAKVKLRTDLSCCWQRFTFFLCHSRPAYTKKGKLQVKLGGKLQPKWQKFKVVIILRNLCLLEMCWWKVYYFRFLKSFFPPLQKLWLNYSEFGCTFELWWRMSE